jgi:hypothetical protein
MVGEPVEGGVSFGIYNNQKTSSFDIHHQELFCIHTSLEK